MPAGDSYEEAAAVAALSAISARLVPWLAWNRKCENILIISWQKLSYAIKTPKALY